MADWLDTDQTCEVDGDTLRLTTEGLARADQIGPWLFSETVRRRMATYDLQ